MIKVSLEEILKLERLDDKEYAIKEIDHSVRGELITAQLLFKGAIKRKIYYGFKKFSRLGEGSDRIKLDKDGLPYYEKSLGPLKYKIYEEIFLGNTGYGAALAGTNQNLLLAILSRFKSENHFVYKEFNAYLNELIKKVPQIKKAKDKKYFFNDTKYLDKFPDLDLKIYEYLTTKEISVSSDEYNPNNYGVNKIKLNDRQKVDFRIGSTKEEAAFILWYHNYMLSKNYEKKIEDPFKKESDKLCEWIAVEAKKLEKLEFKRVEQLSYK